MIAVAMYAETNTETSRRESISLLSPTDSWSSYFDPWIDEPITPPRPTSFPGIADPWQSSSTNGSSGDWTCRHDVDLWLEEIDARSSPLPQQYPAQKEPTYGLHLAPKIDFRRYDADAVVRKITFRSSKFSAAFPCTFSCFTCCTATSSPTTQSYRVPPLSTIPF